MQPSNIVITVFLSCLLSLVQFCLSFDKLIWVKRHVHYQNISQESSVIKTWFVSMKYAVTSKLFFLPVFLYMLLIYLWHIFLYVLLIYLWLTIWCCFLKVLCRWILSVKKNYRKNVAYHNWRHAFNTAQCMFAALKSGKIQVRFAVTTLRTFWLNKFCNGT